MYGLLRSPAKTIPAGAATASSSSVRKVNRRVESPLGRSLSDPLVFITGDATERAGVQIRQGGTGGRQDLGMRIVDNCVPVQRNSRQRLTGLTVIFGPYRARFILATRAAQARRAYRLNALDRSARLVQSC